MPRVFVKAIMTNHIGELFLADFQRPKNFQNIDHIIITDRIAITVKGEIP